MSKVTLTHKGKSFDVDVEKSCDVKLYLVPKEYSDDGYYVSQWGFGEAQPFPACEGSEAKMLCHASVYVGEDGVSVNVNTSNDGASCHA